MEQKVVWWPVDNKYSRKRPVIRWRDEIERFADASEINTIMIIMEQIWKNLCLKVDSQWLIMISHSACYLLFLFQSTQSVPIQSLYYWLKENLIPNPFGPSACASSGRRLSWRMLGKWPLSWYLPLYKSLIIYDKMYVSKVFSIINSCRQSYKINIKN